MLKRTSVDEKGRDVVEIDSVHAFFNLPPASENIGKSINVCAFAHMVVDSFSDIPPSEDFAQGITVYAQAGNFFGIGAGIHRVENGKWNRIRTAQEAEAGKPGLYESDGKDWNYVFSLEEAEKLSINTKE